jgi:hypothetical protein
VTRRLFIYFRVAHESEAAVVATVRELQQAWQVAMPGLRCDVLRRVDEGSNAVTLMETYSCGDGISAQWQQRIEREVSERLQPWLLGERHAEAFEPCA